MDLNHSSPDNNIEKDVNFNDNQLNVIEVNNNESYENSFNLRDRLFSWVIEKNITQKSVNSLLEILRGSGHNTLSQDARTLMHTKNATQEIKKIAGDSCIHFGVADGLLRSITKYFKECSNNIDLLINVDSISMSKSSTSQFWPILVFIFSNVRTKPFAAGVYHGISKPNDVNQYLSPLVNELILLEEHGFNYHGKTVVVKGIICDAPARAFITCTKNHSFGCSTGRRIYLIMLFFLNIIENG